MTVCIAAIFNNNSILGVSDRMITAGDIEFQPPQPKIYPITSSIAIMTAGDTNVQTQVLTKTGSVVRERITAHPEIWIPVTDVASLYGDTYLKIKAELAEKTILSPYGLNYESFVARQKEMSADFIERISYAIQKFSIDDIETIVTGIDETGSHIFVVRNGTVSWSDIIGFASVGIGSNHALSHLMLSGYTRGSSESKALLTVHQAKKNAEVSPGVGEQTDMFVIGPNIGSFNMIQPLPTLDIVKDLDGFYKTYKKKINNLDKNTEDKIKDYLAQLVLKASPKQEVNATSSLSPSKSVKPTPTPPSKVVKQKKRNTKKN